MVLHVAAECPRVCRAHDVATSTSGRFARMLLTQPTRGADRAHAARVLVPEDCHSRLLAAILTQSTGVGAANAQPVGPRPAFPARARTLDPTA
jgi:hypothetical protein